MRSRREVGIAADLAAWSFAAIDDGRSQPLASRRWQSAWAAGSAARDGCQVRDTEQAVSVAGWHPAGLHARYAVVWATTAAWLRWLGVPSRHVRTEESVAL